MNKQIVFNYLIVGGIIGIEVLMALTPRLLSHRNNSKSAEVLLSLIGLIGFIMFFLTVLIIVI